MPSTGKRGRPPKLNDALTRTIAASVKGGIGLARAAQMAGIGKATVFDWMARGAREQQDGRDTRYTRFAKEIAESRASAIAICESTVLHAAVRKQDWRAAVTYLERTVPQEWGRKDSVSVNIQGALQEMLDQVQPRMSAGAFQELLMALAEVHGVKQGIDTIEIAALPA